MRIPLVLILLAAGLPCGCSTTSGSPYATPAATARSPLEAERLTLKGADLIATEPDKAEQLFREALTADLYHGPAHSNLGVLYLKQGKLYEAANEFEWARKLMPGHPDPRLNLAITLERAGRIDEALAAYASALEVYANHLPTVQALARCQLRHDHADERTRVFLEQIAMQGESEEWREWARRRMALGDDR